jgi:hypothetical protein
VSSCGLEPLLKCFLIVVCGEFAIEQIGNWEVKYNLFMDVSSLEHVVIRAKLGDIIGFQIIQIAAQQASFN